MSIILVCIMNTSNNQTNKGILLQCHRCPNQWTYRGNNPFYGVCSFCRTTVNIKKNRIQADALIGVSHQPDRSLRGKPS
jgi:hypothetical protein